MPGHITLAGIQAFVLTPGVSAPGPPSATYLPAAMMRPVHVTPEEALHIAAAFSGRGGAAGPGRGSSLGL